VRSPTVTPTGRGSGSASTPDRSPSPCSGARGGRTHTVIGDTVNTASRIEGIAPVGGVAIGAATLAELPGATTRPMGPVTLRGKKETAEAFVLVGLD
jgi:class 3 adenylate cyclase